jgi:hypothetical protein
LAVEVGSRVCKIGDAGSLSRVLEGCEEEEGEEMALLL